MGRLTHNLLRTLLAAVITLGFGGLATAQAPANPAQRDPAAGFEGRKVAAVRVVADTGEDLAGAETNLPQRAGQPYDSLAVRESLKALYRTGKFSDIQAIADETGAGIVLRFVVQMNLYINRVQVTGFRHPANAALATSALRLEAGRTFRRAELDEALQRAEAVLRDEGFYEATYQPVLRANAATRQMDILIQAEEGPRARIGKVSVNIQDEEPLGLSNEELLRRSKLKTGDVAKSERLQSAGDRLRKLLLKRGHLAARVTPRRGAYDEVSKQVDVALDVFAGALVDVDVEGAKFTQRKLRKVLPIFQEGAVDDDLLHEGRRVLRDQLEAQGYFDSSVRFRVEEDAKTRVQHIVYQVERGERRRLVGVEFEGNRYFSNDILRAYVRIQPQSFLSRGRFNRALLEDDVDSVRALYAANGFAQAAVKPDVLDNYQGKTGDLLVRFQIEEGPQTLISEFRLEGNSALSSEFLRGTAIDRDVGQPFSNYNVASDRDNVLAIYFNEGFPEARFDYMVQPAAEPNRVRLTYTIHEGPQVRVRNLLISGLEHTREATVRGQVLVEPGGPLRQGSVIETQRRLYNLGIFSRVQIVQQNPTGSDTEKTVVVLLEEAPRYTIAYGGGFEIEKVGKSSANPTGSDYRVLPRVLFEVTKNNVFGRAHTAGLRLRASPDQGRATLNYSAPAFFSNPALTATLSGFAEKARDVRTFSSQRYEGAFTLSHRISPATTLAYRYAYRRVLVDASTLKIDPNQIPLFSQPTKVSGFGVLWVRDRRDDAANPSEGSFNTMDSFISLRATGATADFVRVSIQNATYKPLTRNLVFARSVRLGIQTPFSSTLSTQIPLPERFFAGGGASFRGFGLNQAGPRDTVTGFPLGGLALLILNQELRFPLRVTFAGGALGGALFYDAGNVFTRFSRITLRPSKPIATPVLAPPSPDDLNYFAHAVGFGLRYKTPIGPVRLDFGLLLNPGRFTVQTSPGVFEVRRLSRFNFSFNIGGLF